MARFVIGALAAALALGGIFLFMFGGSELIWAGIGLYALSWLLWLLRKRR